MCKHAECPECGSDQHCKKIAEPSRHMLELESIDPDRAGTYHCHNCGTEFLFEAEIPVFSPRAECTHCGSFDTLITGRQSSGNRYHYCQSCELGFKTRDAARIKSPRTKVATLFNAVEK